MQAEDLRHVIQWEVILHMDLHLVQSIQNDWSQIIASLLFIELPSCEVLLVLISVDLLHGQVVQFRLVLGL